MLKIVSFLKNGKGATAIEYGRIAALIAVAAVGTMKTLGTRLGNSCTNVQSNLAQ